LAEKAKHRHWVAHTNKLTFKIWNKPLLLSTTLLKY
jgi:hypothetical protein